MIDKLKTGDTIRVKRKDGREMRGIYILTIGNKVVVKLERDIPDGLGACWALNRARLLSIGYLPDDAEKNRYDEVRLTDLIIRKCECGKDSYGKYMSCLKCIYDHEYGWYIIEGYTSQFKIYLRNLGYNKNEIDDLMNLHLSTKG